MPHPQTPFNYAAMPDHELLSILGDDAAKWAAAFCQITKVQVAEELMVAWFANAIENSWSTRMIRCQPETKLKFSATLRGRVA